MVAILLSDWGLGFGVQRTWERVCCFLDAIVRSAWIVRSDMLLWRPILLSIVRMETMIDA